MLFTKAQCIRHMAQAIQTQTPTRINCGHDIVRARQRFYRTRRNCQARDDFRFDRLKFEIDGATLVIGRRTSPTLAQRGHKLWVLRQLRALAVEWRFELPNKVDR